MKRPWSERWRARLHELGYPAPKGPGRRAPSLEIGPGRVRAALRGREPVEVTLELDTLSPGGRVKLVEELARKARHAAGLLAGRLPEDVEIAFALAGRGLLPGDDEPRASCTCDAPHPCRHILVVVDEVARRLDGDPFLLLTLRGMPKDELLADLRAKRETVAAAAIADSPRAAPPVAEGSEGRVALPAEELPDVKPELFFKPLLPLVSLRTTIGSPDHPDAILTRLGPPPLEEPEVAGHMVELLRAIGLGAKERLAEWEWRRSVGRRR